METNKKSKGKLKLFLFSLLSVFLFFLLAAQISVAQPTGLEIQSGVTESRSDVSPDSRTDSGGTINTILVDVVQQNPRWKAYVGNLTGVLTLDDESGQSIFRWELEDEDVTGNVFISRSDSINWSDIDCPTDIDIENEDSSLGFSSTSADSVNRTFSEETHPTISIGLTNIDENTCRSTSTFVSNNPQDHNNADFPLILLASGSDLVYATPINKGTQSYNTGSLVDFQSIVPDQVVGTSTYYFYAEIGA